MEENNFSPRWVQILSGTRIVDVQKDYHLLQSFIPSWFFFLQLFLHLIPLVILICFSLRFVAHTKFALLTDSLGFPFLPYVSRTGGSPDGSSYHAMSYGAILIIFG